MSNKFNFFDCKNLELDDSNLKHVMQDQNDSKNIFSLDYLSLNILSLDYLSWAIGICDKDKCGFIKNLIRFGFNVESKHYNEALLLKDPYLVFLIANALKMDTSRIVQFIDFLADDYNKKNVKIFFTALSKMDFNNYWIDLINDLLMFGYEPPPFLLDDIFCHATNPRRITSFTPYEEANLSALIKNYPSFVTDNTLMLAINSNMCAPNVIQAMVDAGVQVTQTHLDEARKILKDTVDERYIGSAEKVVAILDNAMPKHESDRNFSC